MSEEKDTNPPHSITVKVNGEVREIFMSFNLLNRICYLMGDATQIPAILQDPELREEVLREALTVREKGKPPVKPETADLDMSFEDVQNVLEFCSDHAWDFTGAAVERANKLALKHAPRIQAAAERLSSTVTPSGSGTSALKSPAA